MAFTTYRQQDSRWGSKNYNGNTMANAGCGPTACAILISSLDTKVTPWTTAQYMKKHGYAIKGNGTAWAGITACLKAYGFDAKNINIKTSMTPLWNELAKKKTKCGILLFSKGTRGGVTWTKGGHYVAFTDYKIKKGKHYFYTRDPNKSRRNDGWHCYETTMRGLLPTCFVAIPKSQPKPEVKKSYSGKFPEIHVKRTAQEVANEAAEWAEKIATLDTFHYGEGGNSKKDFGADVYKITHSTGCYFCGTNATSKVAKIKKLKRKDLIADNWYKTYVCNPFVYSSFVHGGLVPNMFCKNNGNLSIFTNSSTFKKLGHPAYSSLKKGDVLLKYVNGTFKHAAIYVGDGNYSEATSYVGKYGNKSSKSSIRTKALTTSHYKVFNVVCRYNKPIDADISIKPGEYSSRVGYWQDYLNWWSDGKFYKECGGKDNMFGANTKAWTIKFQESEVGKGQGDGLVGNKTIAAAKAVKK